MARKGLTQAEKLADYERLKQENRDLSLALLLVKTSSFPDFTRHVTGDEDECYFLDLYGGERSDGGVVVVTFAAPGQSETVSVYGTHDFHRYWIERQKIELGATELGLAEAAAKIQAKVNELGLVHAMTCDRCHDPKEEKSEPGPA